MCAPGSLGARRRVREQAVARADSAARHTADVSDAPVIAGGRNEPGLVSFVRAVSGGVGHVCSDATGVGVCVRHARFGLRAYWRLPPTWARRASAG